MSSGYKLIALAEAQPGMVLSDDLLDRRGHTLLAKGTILTSMAIASLGRHGIGTVAVVTEDRPALDPGQVTSRLDHLFRGHASGGQDGWAAGILRRYVEDYRLGREVAP